MSINYTFSGDCLRPDIIKRKSLQAADKGVTYQRILSGGLLGLKSLSMTGSNDLTKGVIWKQLVKFAIPLILSNMLQSVYGMMDMIITGYFVGPVGLSAVNNSDTIMQLVTSILMGVSTGGSILISQYFGAGDGENCKRTITTLFTFSMAFGAVLMTVFIVFAKQILSIFDAPALEEATRYLLICAIGIIFVAGYNATSAMMRSVGNSRAPLICVIVSCVIDIVLDFVFIGALGWGVAGAAWSTVIGQGCSFIISLVIILRDHKLYGLRLTRLYIRADKLRTMLKLGIPVCVQMTVANISWLSVMYLINGYGVFVSAGNGVSIKIKSFCLLFIGAMSSGSSAMIAQNIGARQYDRARKVMFTAMRIAVSASILIIAAVEVFAPSLVSIFTSDAGTAAAATRNLRIEIISQVFYAVFQMYHSLAIGVGHTWFVLVSSFTNCILVRVVLIFLLNHFIGLTGIYIACMIAPASSIPIGIWYERSGRWRKHPQISAETADISPDVL